MRVTPMLGFVAIFSVVIGCSSPGQAPPDDQNSGDQNPEGTGTQAPAPADSTGGGGGGNEKSTTVPPAGSATTPGTTPTTSPTTPPAPKPKSTMTFFVTSTGSGALGGNLGGLVGADKKCQDLATAVTGGDHTWHAYLSVTGTSAKDRIGTGPWTNQKGKVIAATVVALHDYNFIPASADLVDEKGAIVPLTVAAILTGSKQDGTPAAQTCTDWTSATANTNGHVGDAASDTSVLLGDRWNDAVKNSACTQAGLTAGKGEGRLYCFAID